MITTTFLHRMIPLQSWNEALHAVTVYAEEIVPTHDALRAEVWNSGMMLRQQGRMIWALEAGVNNIIDMGRDSLKGVSSGQEILVGTANANAGNNLFRSAFVFCRGLQGLTMGIQVPYLDPSETLGLGDRLEEALAERLGKLRGLKSAHLRVPIETREDLARAGERVRPLRESVSKDPTLRWHQEYLEGLKRFSVDLISAPGAPIFEAGHQEKVKGLAKAISEAL